MVITLKILKYIRKFKGAILFSLVVLFSASLNAQNQRWYIGVMAGYEFASAYYEQNDEISFNEHIKTNYRFGLITGKINDSVLINHNFGIYYQYRSFSVDFQMNELDPDYNNYLLTIKPQYHIIGIPLLLNWKLFSKNNFFVKANTGLSFEFSFKREETTTLSDGESNNSKKLIADDDWRLGIPLKIGIGLEFDPSQKIRLGIYPCMNLYMKKFNNAAESGLASTFGINLILIKKP